MYRIYIKPFLCAKVVGNPTLVKVNMLKNTHTRITKMHCNICSLIRYQLKVFEHTHFYMFSSKSKHFLDIVIM